MKKTVFATLLVCLSIISEGQNYQAIHGSPYAGSLGIYNNPATGIHSQDNWDITLFSTQSKSSTNAFSSTKPLIKLSEANVYLSNGDKPRYIHESQDLHVLNTRFKLNQTKAIAFGFNSRNYAHIKSNAFKFIDTISDFNSFLQFNRPSPSMGGTAINNSWAELYASYCQIIRNTNLDQLSVGITLKAIRAISGIYLRTDIFRFTEVPQPGLTPSFLLTDAEGSYGYSSNYDKLQENNSVSKNIDDFLTYSQGSMGIDIGAEYILKNDYAPQYDDNEKNIAYNWKIGVSILDLGRNHFKTGRYSRHFSGVLTDITEADLENKFSSPDDIKDFYDSLETVMKELVFPGPDFYISQPTRIVVNVDKPISDNFFINAELNINLFSTSNKKHLHTRELSLLTVTPRWETYMLGLYLPIQFTTQGQLWVGTAFKAGPLLMGIHDWRSILGKNRVFNGGAYVAVVVRNFFSPSSGKTKRIKYMDCPPI